MKSARSPGTGWVCVRSRPDRRRRKAGLVPPDVLHREREQGESVVHICVVHKALPDEEEHASDQEKGSSICKSPQKRDHQGLLQGSALVSSKDVRGSGLGKEQGDSTEATTAGVQSPPPPVASRGLSGLSRRPRGRRGSQNVVRRDRNGRWRSIPGREAEPNLRQKNPRKLKQGGRERLVGTSPGARLWTRIEKIPPPPILWSHPSKSMLIDPANPCRTSWDTLPHKSAP